MHPDNTSHRGARGRAAAERGPTAARFRRTEGEVSGGLTVHSTRHPWVVREGVGPCVEHRKPLSCGLSVDGYSPDTPLTPGKPIYRQEPLPRRV